MPCTRNATTCTDHKETCALKAVLIYVLVNLQVVYQLYIRLLALKCAEIQPVLEMQQHVWNIKTLLRSKH